MACLTTTEVAEYVAGQVDASTRARIDRHMDGCSRCAAWVAQAAAEALPADTPQPEVNVEGPEPAPSSIGRYRLLEVLGRGGMGTVYEAHDPSLQRNVAVKVLHSKRSGAEQSEGHARLVREARALAAVSHPNLVEVYEVGQDAQRAFIAMERLYGEDLRAWYRAGTHRWRDVLDRLLQAAEGLQAAHEAGVLHRDFKPDNVFCGNDGRVRVMDFGLAVDDGLSQAPSVDPMAGSGSHKLTQTGSVMGTPAYMAPEQWRCEPADGRCDQYAFAVTLWEGVYGVRPFRATDVDALEIAVLEGVPEAPAGRHPPTWLRRIMLRALARNPQERYPSMRALIDDVRASGRPRRARWAVVAGAGLMGGIAFASMADRNTPKCPLEPAWAAWSPSRADRLRQGFSSTQLGYAGASTTTVVQRVDRFAAHWAEVQPAACKLEGARRDRALACLHAATAEVEHALDSFESDPGGTLSGAAQTALGFADPNRCIDDQLGTYASADLESRLAQVRRVPDFDARAAAAVELAEDSDAQSHRGFAARALLVASSANERQGKIDEALALVERAARWSEESGADEVSAQAWISVAFLRGEELRDADGAEEALRFAGARVQRLGNPPAQVLRLELARASVRYRAGRFASALQAHRAAMQHLDAVMAEPLLVARAHSVGGAISLALGNAQDALGGHQQAQETLAMVLGDSHPARVSELVNEANVLTRLGRDEEAISTVERALALASEDQQARPTFIAQIQNNLGNLYAQNGRLNEAVDLLQAATKAIREVAPEHPNLPMMLENTAGVLRTLGRGGQALALHDEAVSLRERALGPDHPQLGFSHSNRGETLLALDRPAEALEPLRKAVALHAKAESADPVDLASARYLLATALHETDGAQEARRQLERAAASLQNASDPDAVSLRDKIVAELAQ